MFQTNSNISNSGTNLSNRNQIQIPLFAFKYTLTVLKIIHTEWILNLSLYSHEIVHVCRKLIILPLYFYPVLTDS